MGIPCSLTILRLTSILLWDSLQDVKNLHTWYENSYISMRNPYGLRVLHKNSSQDYRGFYGYEDCYKNSYGYRECIENPYGCGEYSAVQKQPLARSIGVTPPRYQVIIFRYFSQRFLETTIRELFLEDSQKNFQNSISIKIQKFLPQRISTNLLLQYLYTYFLEFPPLREFPDSSIRTLMEIEFLIDSLQLYSIRIPYR